MHFLINFLKETVLCPRFYIEKKYIIWLFSAIEFCLLVVFSTTIDNGRCHYDGSRQVCINFFELRQIGLVKERFGFILNNMQERDS